MKRFTRHMPLLLAFVAGFGCFIWGRATHGDVSNDWLAFAGSLIGTALAALVGFWLITVQERRATALKRLQLLEALQYLEKTVIRMRAAGKEDVDQDDAAATVGAVAVAAKVFDHVRNVFGLTNVRTVLPLESLSAFLASIDLQKLENNTRLMRKDHHAQYFRFRDEGASLFDDQADGVLILIAEVRRTLN